jgi:hypothetical protein
LKKQPTASCNAIQAIDQSYPLQSLLLCQLPFLRRLPFLLSFFLVVIPEENLRFAFHASATSQSRQYIDHDFVKQAVEILRSGTDSRSCLRARLQSLP